jgi:phosphatidylglycerol---prolipoprotein diacylglyceryl transferase
MLAYYVHDLNPFIFKIDVPDIDLYIFHIGGEIGPRWYGLAYVLAFLCSYLLFRQLSKRGYADLPLTKVGDFITAAALFGVIVGGRLGYVFFYAPEMLHEPISILKVWKGGMSSHGGMFGLLAFTFYYAWRHKISWTNLGDNLGVTAPIGLFFGRCANFINGELYGRATNVSWAVQFPKELTENVGEAERAIIACRQIDPSLNSSDAIVAAVRHQPQVKEGLRGILTPRHPSQLYEAFFEGIVLFAILWLVRTRMRQPNGVLTGLFLICYAIFRIAVENFREPDATLIAGFTRGQFFSFFLIAIGLAIVTGGKLRPTFPKKIAARD